MIRKTEYEKAVAGLYLLRLKSEETVNLMEFTFGEHRAESLLAVRVATIPIPTNTGGKLWFSGTVGGSDLESEARDHEHQFFGIYDADSPELAELVASAYHYNRTISGLDYGHTFPLSPRMPLRRSGYSAALVLDPGVYKPFEKLEAEIAGVTTSFFSTIPIRADELKLKEEEGLLALMDEWDKRDRDIVAVETAKLS